MAVLDRSEFPAPITAGTGDVRMDYPLSRVVPFLLLLVTAGLGAAHVFSRMNAVGHPESAGYQALDQLFYLSAEANVPTWFTSTMWFAAALLSLRLARIARVDRLSWLIVAVVCTILSLDEEASLHERLGDIGRGVAATVLPEGLGFVYAWTVFGVAFLAVVGLVLAPFVWRLPRHASIGIIIAGTVFVIGAIGFENLGAAVAPHGWTFKGVWLLLSLAEETLEMAGVIIFLHVLLWMLEREGAGAGVAADQDLR